jgi:hypothetical protein
MPANGIYGTSGVPGPNPPTNLPTIAGVFGTSEAQAGVIGTSNSTAGVLGFSNNVEKIEAVEKTGIVPARRTTGNSTSDQFFDRVLLSKNRTTTAIRGKRPVPSSLKFTTLAMG